MTSEMASVCSESVMGMLSKLELEMASAMLSERKLIDWARLLRGDPPCLIGYSSVLFSVLFETDVIAVLEKC
jgi:hypothetical protein